MDSGIKERLIVTLTWLERLYPIGFLLWWIIFTLNNGYYPDSMLTLWFVLAFLWLPMNLVRWILTGDCSILEIKAFLQSKLK